MPWPVNDASLLLAFPLPVIKRKLQLMALAELSPVGKMKMWLCKAGGLNHCLVLLSYPVRHIWNGQQQRTLCCAVPWMSSLFHLGRQSLHPCLFRGLSARLGRKDCIWDGFQMLILLLEPGLGTITFLPITVPLWNGLFVQGVLQCSRASKEKSLCYKNCWKCHHFRSTPVS